MDEVVDPFEVPAESLEQKAEEAEARKTAAVRSVSREAAIERGRAYGEGEANRRGEDALATKQRVARAMRYAAWEYDGKPMGKTAEYDAEFGMKTVAGTLSAWQVGADPKGGDKK